MELEMLEDWLNNPEPVGDYHEQILAEEILRNRSEFSARELKR
jgi:hypothetical protein